MRRRPRTSATCSGASPEARGLHHDVAAGGQLEHLVEQVALQHEICFPPRLRGQAADLEVEPVEPAGAGPGDEVPQLDVERGDPAGVDLADQVGDLAAEVSGARAVEQLDFTALELMGREAPQLAVLVDVRVVD